ncbi:MAG TPA: SCO family protein [Candidatus Angelobacter sp.]|nr:SCO family protein [Candidatus Angelobacter sp.]
MVQRNAVNLLHVWLLLWLLPGNLGLAQNSDSRPVSVPSEVVEAPAVSIPDVVMTNEHGQRVRLLSDVIGDRVVVINTVFTTCTTICLPMGANFGKLEKLLGNNAGRDVILISISIDAANDTPERLRAWAEQFGEGPGWTLLTGDKRDVDTALKAMGVYTPDKLQHTSTILIGRAKNGEWVRTNGLAKASALAEIVKTLLTKGTRPAGTSSR